jgi:N-acyl-L-homoserine lactone synthetase
MARILSSADKPGCRQLFEEMFQARAAVFHDRLGWDLDVHDGMEFDHYDENDDVIYVVTEDPSGFLTGSLRLLPTTGENMLRNEFSDFFSETVDIQCPTVWECTRFCIHPRARHAQITRQVSSELLMALCELCLENGIERIVGLYFEHMTRIYRRIGWAPEPFAISRPEIGNLVLGIWDVSHEAIKSMRERANRNDVSSFTMQATCGYDRRAAAP